jgi:diguanylate cyclase (GGDEF)-like protein
MASDSSDDSAAEAPQSSDWRPHHWAIWSIPARVMVSVLLVEITAVALVSASVRVEQFDLRSLGLAGLLCLFGIAHTEIAVRVERIRRRIAVTAHVDLSSVWTFAAALLLPLVLASVVAIIVFTHLWWRSWRPRVPVYRHVFSTATIVLACLAASAVMSASRGDGGIDLLSAGLALLVYTTVNSALIAGAIAMSSAQPDLSEALGRWDDNVLEIATLSLGALAAVALTTNPFLVAFVLPPLLVLHRAVLVRHLEEAANTDGKTGLLNAAAWLVQAERAVRRAGRRGGPCGVLVLDLDHFKAVNDTHGHIAGDHVLSAVAETLRTEVRERDIVGRFGGEEFVVLLAALGDSGAAELEAVAERIRRRVAELQVEIPTPDGPLTVSGLSVSIGAAVTPVEETELRTVLQAADTALYAAKRAGRNLVRLGRPLPVPSPSTSTSTAPPAAAG